MYYLVYASKSNVDWSKSDLKDLLTISRQNNSRTGITGMLIYMKDRFIQLLEGSEKNVKECFLTITQDERHSKIVILLEGTLEDRIFEDWHMGFDSLNEDQLHRHTGFRNLENLFDSQKVTDESHPALIFLKLFYDKNRQETRSSLK